MSSWVALPIAERSRLLLWGIPGVSYKRRARRMLRSMLRSMLQPSIGLARGYNPETRGIMDLQQELENINYDV